MNTEQLLSFLEEKAKGGYIRVNDFIKSFYPLPKANEPAKWNNQQEMKRAKIWLDGLVKSGQITVMGNKHNDLGRPYYEGVQQVQKFHNLNTISVEAKLGLDE